MSSLRPTRWSALRPNSSPSSRSPSSRSEPSAPPCAPRVRRRNTVIMFIIIVGGGKVGTYLARGLIRQQHEVVVIEKDAKKAQLMTNTLETDVAIVGDGCDPNVLMQAGIVRADVVVADTGDDEDNLVVVLIAKKHSKARCIARVNNPKNKLI